MSTMHAAALKAPPLSRPFYSLRPLIACGGGSLNGRRHDMIDVLESGYDSLCSSDRGAEATRGGGVGTGAAQSPVT